MIEYEAIRRFYDANRPAARERDADFTRGTVESSTGIIRFRNRAEARHLDRVLTVPRGAEVLDLGGGSGRFAAYFAARARHVTLVDLAPSLVATARQTLAQAGHHNVSCLEGSLLDPPIDSQRKYDVVHVGNVLVYINDEDLPRARDVIERHTAAGGAFVLREPVDPHGPSVDERPGGYRALYRQPEIYAELFAPSFRLRYQRVTISHLVPPGQSTASVVGNLRTSSWKRALVDHVLPLLAYVDRPLLELEETVRASRFAGLLGDPGVVQHFYIFERR